MKKIPVVGCINCTMAFIKEGYFFIQNKSRQLETKIFQTNFLFQKIIFITGEEAAKVFYDPEKFVRKKAVPMRIQKTLLGKRGVQTLDEEVHRNRKEMFMSLMTDKRIEELISITKNYWDSHLVKWITSDKLILFEEAKEILCKSACKWVGVPLKEDEVKRRANDLWALVDAFGAVGPRHWKGLRARRITERWIEDIVKDARAGRIQLENDCAAARIIFHKGLDGTLLDDRIASVEIINLLRPIVAIANYITFAAHAIYENPHYQQKLAEGNNEYIERFVQEVRRFYPFAPFTGARVRNDFFWRGYLLPKNSLVFLDIYGTNFDSGIWERPEEFWPDHFKFWNKSPYSFIPQGGGEHRSGHRCAGEKITIEIMKSGVYILARRITYQVPDQDLSIPLNRIPAMVKSGFIINKVTIPVKKKTDNFNNPDFLDLYKQRNN